MAVIARDLRRHRGLEHDRAGDVSFGRECSCPEVRCDLDGLRDVLRVGVRVVWFSSVG